VGVYQYVFFRTIVSIMMLGFQAGGLYDEGEARENGALAARGRGRCSADAALILSVSRPRAGSWSPARFYLYATIIINCSQMYALACLALFYFELRSELAPLKPLGKFLVRSVWG
jgi:hypothetical protein